jgi:trimeric autotransporter adhesin
MGAYESGVDDGVLFAVTTTDDCSTPLNLPSCGSLRDAIARATAPTSTAPVKTIKFWIIDWMNQPICPAVIHVASSLPDITTNVVIDGFSQGSINEIDPPLSWPNMDPYIFNANLCLDIVGPGSGVAFRVPAGSDGSLTLRGVGLGGFQQGVMLLGGGNHQIAGNQFGGVTSNGVDLGGFSIQAVNMSPANQPSGALIIGGDNVADRNVFLNAFSFGASAAKAIFIGPGTISDPSLCQIDGNLVGILPDGTGAPGNDYGLVLTGDGCTVRSNWVTGSHKGAIWVQGQHYVLQGNVLGLAPRTFAPQNNGGFGIRINGSNNLVGAAASDTVSLTPFIRGVGNYIEDMSGNGIVIASPGTGNTLRGNWIINSGAGSGMLAVDLGEDGATSNDVGDSDAGANNLQNFPEPHGFTWAAPPQPGVTNDATVRMTLMSTPMPASYNVDVYLGSGCDPAGRGLPELWIGRYSANVPSSPATNVFEVPVSIPDYFDPAHAAISLMATSLADNDTSEISACLPIDSIFRDGLEL